MTDNDPEALPAPWERSSNRSHDGSEAWIRLAAFVSAKSMNTQATYRGIVVEWCRFIGAVGGTPDGATKLLAADDIRALAYRRWLTQQPGQRPRSIRSKGEETTAVQVAPDPPPAMDGLQATHASATIRKKLSVLRRIYRMLQGAGLVTKNPFDSDIVPPPGKGGQKRPTEMIDYELVRRMLELPDLSTARGVRDRAVLALLFGGGLRRSEARALVIDDVKRSQKGVIYVRLRATKNKTDADQPLPDWAAEAVILLIRQRETQGALGGDPLLNSFVGRAGATPVKRGMSSDGIYKLFRRYADELNLWSATPHSARATAITRLLDSGVSMRDVQAFSRHSSVQMVEVYDKRRLNLEDNPGRALKF